MWVGLSAQVDRTYPIFFNESDFEIGTAWISDLASVERGTGEILCKGISWK